VGGHGRPGGGGPQRCPLSPEHGAPLRLILSTEIGCKSVEGLVGLALVERNLGGTGGARAIRTFGPAL
jgi:DMSO/TMAO reductase YedYZ molybdopterin-dependent catalytic subunit